MTRTRKTYLFLIAIALFYWTVFHLKSALGGQISSDLLDQLEGMAASQQVSAIVYLKDNPGSASKFSELPDRFNRQDRYRDLIGRLHFQAQEGQQNLTSSLRLWMNDGKVTSFKNYWIANAIAVTAPIELINQLAGRNDIEMIYPDYPVTLVAPVDEKEILSAGVSLDAVQTAIGAKQVWQEGLTGKSRLICILDTGVDGLHPALASSWRGRDASVASATESWWDPFGTSFPKDDQGHGTHVAGIICGRSATDSIGIAPEAEWIAAAVVDRGTTKDVTITNILDALQWAVNPDGDTTTFDDVPDVINNSWGFPKSFYPDCEELFWQAIDNVEAAGIVVVFAAGNEGPDRSTMRVPADRSSSPYNSFAVGAVSVQDYGFQIAPFSSRGPSRCDSTRAKPEMVAPGVDIYSCYPGGQYKLMSGTSMAAPMISAAVVILRQLDPEISVDQIKEVLIKTATDQGPAGKDNDYGSGVINIAAAVEYWKEVKKLNEPAAAIPQDFRLQQNYPNPFNAGTTIRYEVKPNTSGSEKVKLKIYNVLGQQVKNLVNGFEPAGFYSINWDGTDDQGEKVGTGIYFYRFEAGDFSQTKKMVLLK
ncbi:MAG: hypothetical protein A2Z27_01330 [candidate division Zixibacteria bacterium RBG_16_50_21]|nr:MAG: hypothetical protein A2Z27_01330 [candidate division Zixibacteria bacterium RBG_16_50_21]